MAGPFGTANAGSIVELPDDLAKRVIAGGYAVAVNPPALERVAARDVTALSPALVAEASVQTSTVDAQAPASTGDDAAPVSVTEETAAPLADVGAAAVLHESSEASPAEAAQASGVEASPSTGGRGRGRRK
jgi:hypothetical protein